MLYCRTFFKYKNITPSIKKEILCFCKENKNITWVVIGEGKYNLSMMIICEDLATIEAIYDTINAKFGKYLGEPYISLAFSIRHYKHNYLYGTKDHKELILGKKTKPKSKTTKPSFDKKDLALIKLLANNARISLIDAAKELNTTPKLISYRIKKLKANDIILAFRAKINTRLLGYECFKIFLKLQHFTDKNRKKIITYLGNFPNVIYITKPMGTHNLEFEIMVKDMNRLHEIMEEIRMGFPDILVDYDTNLYYDEPLLTYFPA